MEIEEPTPQSTPRSRLKPNRACTIILLLAFTLSFILYRFYVSQSQDIPSPPGGQVSILLDEPNPHNVTSDVDIVHSLTREPQVVSIKGLMENGTAASLRITRADGGDGMTTYRERGSGRKLTMLEDIKPSTQNIFFIETRCGTSKRMKQYSVDSGVVLNARQICSVESTAKMNPSRPVYLLHTCPLDDSFYEKSPRFVQELLSYPNVHVVFLDMSEFFLRTNVEELYFGGRFEESKHPVEHVSDVVRLLALWRYGGTYMDIDVVSIRPLDSLGTNYAGWQDEHTIASGVLNFQPSGFGHQILTECLDDLRFNFEPNSWSTNGPILVTNTLMRLCGVNSKQSSKCREFTAYPIPVFYPIYYTDWRLFFEERAARRTLNRLNDTFVVHIWNKMSSQGVVRVGSGQAYGILADQYCPKAYRNCGPTF